MYIPAEEMEGKNVPGEVMMQNVRMETGKAGRAEASSDSGWTLPMRCPAQLRLACVCKSFSRVRLFVTPWTITHQAPLSMEFSRQTYWSGWPFSSPGDLPNPGIEPKSPAL